MADLHLLPAVRLPWPPRRNAAWREHEHRARVAALQFGLLGISPSMHDRRRFDGQIMAEAWTYPSASPDRLHAAGGVNQWLHFLDERAAAEAQGPAGAVTRLLDRTFTILETGALPLGPTPFDHFTREVRERLAAVATARWLERFVAELRRCLFEGAVAGSWATPQPCPGSLEDYIKLRLLSSSLWAILDVVELAGDAELPPEVQAHPAVRELRLRAARHAACVRDLFSYHRDVVQGGSRFNLLPVLQAQHRAGLPDALLEAQALLGEEVARFADAERGLPRLSAPDDGALERFVDALRGWVAGHVAWGTTNPRFHAPDATFVELRR